MSRIIFITGTDTGVGKTTLTCLMLQHLRTSGTKALAMKPFCSGGTKDLEAYRAIQGVELSGDLLNPHYFPQPLAPAVAAEFSGKKIKLKSTIESIYTAASFCECLLVEGAGGVMVPITKNLMIIDLIEALNCEVIVVSRNQLGTLNHTFLTIEALRKRGIRTAKVVFFENLSPDKSSSTNLRWLSKTTKNISVFRLPRIRRAAHFRVENQERRKNFQKTLAQICNPDSFCSVVRTAGNKQRNERLKTKK